MNTALWIAQGLLAAGFARSGGVKLATSSERLKERLIWAEDFSVSTVRLIGIAEVAGAIGLVLPPLVGVAPWLAPLAAAGLATIMFLAALTHLRRNEPIAIVVNLIIGAVAVFIVWGRFGSHQF